jgi:hypothetical protein
VEAGSDPRRARVYVAAILAAGLAVAVAVVLLTGREASGAPEADPECVEAWNDDTAATAYGQHQFDGHGYELVQVLRVTDAGAPTDSDDGLCAVVFAATELDPEPGARAQVLLEGRWTGFEELTGVGDRDIGELQSDALAGTNASLTTSGTLVARER